VSEAVDLAIVLLCGAIVPLMMGMIVLATTKGRRRPFSRRLAVRRGGVWRADLSATLFAFAAGMAMSAVVALSLASLS
jgi:hypothetical protein